MQFTFITAQSPLNGYKSFHTQHTDYNLGLNRMASLLLTFNEAGIYLQYSVVSAFNLLFNLFRIVEPLNV